MATSKTLTPTNVTISIPEFTDQPDQRVNSNCIDKEADAINAVNTKLTTADAQSMTNLNDVTSTGLYSYDKLSSAMTNAPSTGTYFSGTLRVTYYNANKVTQEFIESGGRVFTRHKWNGTWNAWQELALNSNIDTVTSTVYGTFCYAQKKSGVVYVYGHSAGDLQLTGNGSWQSLTTLPTGFRPRDNVYFSGATVGGKAISFHINTSGVVEYVMDANTSYWNYGCSFLIP